MKYFCSCYWKLWFASCQVVLVLIGCIGSSSSVQTEEIGAKILVTNSPQTSSLFSLDSKRINAIAEQVTVRVWSTSPIGSGTIVKQHGKVYTILTSAHVLKVGDPPYTIQTLDGKRHSAEIVSRTNLDQKDVVLLQFRSSQPIYSIANIGRVDRLSIGKKVYAAGFPLNNRSQLSSQSGSQSNSQLTLREGQVMLLLEKPLKDGYRLAYTSSVDLGMSGGPVLNERGEVIGINGLRDDPIWHVPIKYQDGTKPNSSIEKLIAHSSLAIPLADILCIFD